MLSKEDLDMKEYELIIIGGGPAGISCATKAYKNGVKNILLLERREFTGGILNQCIHDGFGLLSKGKSLTGPEFITELEKELENTDITIERGAYVSEINYNKTPYEVEYISHKAELITCTGKSIVLATGCRERPYGSLRIPGTRPSGIYSAGSAQYMMNMENILPGKSVVILGLGDIGMIMARRLSIEGARVKMILGLEMTGLKRNFKNCVEDFNIPYKKRYTVVKVHGHEHLKGVSIAPVDENMVPDMAKETYIPCDTLLVAAGLIPEDDLCPENKKDGVFLCGNVHKIFSLVDYVVEEGEYTGLKVAEFLNGETNKLSSELNDYEERLKSQNKTLDTIDDGGVTCLKCPKGCTLYIEEKDDGTISVTGNNCPLGIEYARSLSECPRLILTSTVKVKDMDLCLIPVRSTTTIPKEKVKDIMKLVKDIEIDKDTLCGTCIIENACDTGADIVTCGCLKIGD